MKKSVVATALLLLLQGPAIADHSMLCKSLSRRLAAVPEVIGSSSEVRRYAEALRDQEVTIRSLRTELRRSGCGAGSIISYGRSEDICRQIADALRQAEVDRERIRAQRGAALSIIRPNGERNAILAALQENGCGHSAVAPQPVAVVPELPERQPISPDRPASITTIKPRLAAPAEVTSGPTQPGPERPYDPSRKVRTVGPAFLPDDNSIDLANPGAE